ncbi:unnamed protein product [Amoebophrya sp. A120]|nr:unnamed protein product [Amoebophrya sp. A120]|eukprot:GSA120T00022435001.1
MRYRKYNLSQYVVLLLYGETVSDYHDYSTFQLDFHQICKTGSTYFFFITRVVSLEIETSTSYVSKASDVRIYAIATITDTGSGTCSDAKIFAPEQAASSQQLYFRPAMGFFRRR